MSDDNGANQGVHYHYHFYGYGPGSAEGYAPQGSSAAMDPGTMGAGAPEGMGPRGAQDPGQGAGQGAGYMGGQMSGQAGGQGHHGQRRQQAAGAVPPGFPPPGFPFAGGPMAGAQGAQYAQGAQDAQAGTGFNWHQHPAADSLIKGLVVGAGAAYLLTNETAQRTIMRTALQVWGFLQGGIEELKERLHDAEAEVAAAAAPAAPAEPETPPAPSSES